MPMPARRVGMHDHEVIGGVHPFDKFHSNIVDADHVSARSHVEFVGMERENVGIEFVLTPRALREALSTGDELGG